MSELSQNKWIGVTVRELVEKHFCGPSPDCEERQVFAEDEWGVLKTTAITWSGWNESAHKVLPKNYWNQPSIEVRSGDVLVTKAGPRHRVGVVCHVPSTRKQLVVSGKMIGLRPKANTVDPVVLAGLIACRGPQKFIQDRTTGMAESQVNFANEVLLNTPLKVPPLHEQHVISQILGSLDTVIHETESIIAKLQDVKRGLQHDLLTRGLDAKDELRPTQADAPHLYRESPLGWIPRQWVTKSLEDITDTPICYGIVQVFGYVQNGVPVLAIRDLHGDYTTGIHKTALSIDAAYPRSRVKSGDVLLSIKGTIGRIGVVPAHFSGNISRDIALIRPNSFIRSGYLAHLLRSQIGQRLISQAQVGTTRAEISIAPLRKIVIAIPSLDEQRAIESSLEAVDARLQRESQELEKLRAHRSGLMNDLLTGHVRVTNILAPLAGQHHSNPEHLLSRLCHALYRADQRAKDEYRRELLGDAFIPELIVMRKDKVRVEIRKENVNHNAPHLHLSHSDKFDVSISLKDFSILAGKIDGRVLKHFLKQLAPLREQLMEIWNELNEKENSIAAEVLISNLKL